MKNRCVIPVSFLWYTLITSQSFAQSPLYVWDKTIGANSSDLLRSLAQTPDGGFTILCTSGSDSSYDKSQDSKGDTDYWIVRLDGDGNKIWDRTYGGSGAEEPFKIRRTSDGGFIAVGYTDSDSSGDKTENCRGGVDYWVLRIDSGGNKVWDKTFGGDLNDLCYSIAESRDKGFLLVGYSDSDSSDEKSADRFGNSYNDFWLVKIDSEGHKQWDRTLGGTKEEQGYDAIGTPDGGFIVIGASGSQINGNKTAPNLGGGDMWIVKLDSAGNIVWQVTHGGSDNESLGFIDTAGNNCYFISALTLSGISGDKTTPAIGGYDLWVMKIDSVGNKLWDHTYGGTEDEDEYGELHTTLDGGFIVCGTSYSDSSGTKTTHNLGVEQAWVQKADSMGTPQWDITIRDYGHDEFSYGIPSSDGCYFLGNTTDAPAGGFKSENSKGYQDAFIVKFCPEYLLIPNSLFSVSDNPVCVGSCISFFDQSVHDPNSWQWNFEGATPDTSSLQNPSNVCYNTPGTFDVTLITSNVYGIDTLTLTSYITIYTAPDTPIITQSGDTLISSLAGSYQWSLNDYEIPGATNQSYIASETGDYTVIITDEHGCTNSSTVYFVATLSNEINYGYVSIYPNPSSGNFFVKSINRLCENCKIDVTNILGDLVFSSEKQNITGDLVVDLSSLPAGIYYFQLTSTYCFHREKIVIIR
ncbi:MAG TPA: T9SS type A sorting domain-containing protein [Chitinophagales bacterium]|nr:T9SS type A sorting domain-containing protein [Chitinophagales bacterium]